MLFRILILATLAGSMLSLSACDSIIKDERRDGIREILPTLLSTTYTRKDNGSGEVAFTFHYLLGIVDDEGVTETRWEYSIITPQREILAVTEQQMSTAKMGKTEVLVNGDRTRILEVPRGRLRADGTYVLSIAIFYRGELIGEKYKRLVEGETLEETIDYNDLPQFGE